MTPEQKKKLDDLVTQLKQGLNQAQEEIKKEEGPESAADQLATIEKVAGEVQQGMKSFFLTSVDEHPLLALAIANMIGSQVKHILDNHEDMEAGAFAVTIANTVLGFCEGVTHAAVLAVEGGNAG